MKNSTKLAIWNLWHQLENQIPDEDWSVYIEKFVTLSKELSDPIPEDLQEPIFDAVNSVAAFNKFDYFSNTIDEVVDPI